MSSQENITTQTLNSHPILARKQRVRFTLHHLQTDRPPEVLFSGSENAYRCCSEDYSLVHPTFQGSDFEFERFCEQHQTAQAVIRKENWNSSLVAPRHEMYYTKRAGGDFPADFYVPEAEAFAGKKEQRRSSNVDVEYR